MTPYSVETGEADGLATIRLRAAGEGGLEAAFVPSANMVLHSLSRAGRELLAPNEGLRRYLESGTVMGIPLLYPWANRLSGFRYGGVKLDRRAPLFTRDANGLPIHGAAPRLLRWEVVEAVGGHTAAHVHARLGWERDAPAFALFPFPHRVEYRAWLTADAVEIALTVHPTGGHAVPISFGFHPYLRIPGGSRNGAEMTLPARRALLHDRSMIPTGETEPFTPGRRPLGAAAWDEGLSDLIAPTRFVVGDGGEQVSITFLRGYPFAQVFAPAGSAFVCFEPMTAPANALVRGGAALPTVAPGESYEAAFTVAA